MDLPFLRYFYTVSLRLPLEIAFNNLGLEDVNASASTASAVTQIDGIDAATYVWDFARNFTFNQDADAAYNSMFYSPQSTAGLASKSGYFSGGGRGRLGPQTRFPVSY